MPSSISVRTTSSDGATIIDQLFYADENMTANSSSAAASSRNEMKGVSGSPVRTTRTTIPHVDAGQEEGAQRLYQLLRALEIDRGAYRGEPLHKARYALEFRRIFIDCVKQHCDNYRNRGVLISDVGEGNMVIERNPDTDHATGVLVTNCNCAPHNTLAPDGFTTLGSVAHENVYPGPPRFMARELLSPSPPAFFYHRHALESFFYILVWVATHYDLAENKIRGDIEAGFVGSYDCFHTCDAKTALLDDICAATQIMEGTKIPVANLPPTERDAVYKAIGHLNDEWQDLWVNWVERLAKMFKAGFTAADEARAENSQTFNYATCGDLITYERFMAIIEAEDTSDGAE